MTKRSRGSWAVTLCAASGSLCLVLVALVVNVNGQPSTVEATPLGSVDRPAAVAMAAPSVTETASAPEFLAPSATGTVGGMPVTLGLPGRGEVPIDPVGVTPEQGVGIPDDPSRAGWWAAGSAPGDATGSTVLVGHLDSAAHGLGAFAALLDLALGDKVTVRDSSGTDWTYTVTGREQLAKTALPATIFTTQGPPRLVLVTCGGRFDPVAHHYDDNVIVTASRARA